MSDHKNLNINDDFSVKRINELTDNLPLVKNNFHYLQIGRNKDLIFVNGLGTETTIANIFEKKIIRKIVGDPVWERAYNKERFLKTLMIFK